MLLCYLCHHDLNRRREEEEDKRIQREQEVLRLEHEEELRRERENAQAYNKKGVEPKELVRAVSSVTLNPVYEDVSSSEQIEPVPTQPVVRKPEHLFIRKPKTPEMAFDIVDENSEQLQDQPSTTATTKGFLCELINDFIQIITLFNCLLLR